MGVLAGTCCDAQLSIFPSCFVLGRTTSVWCTHFCLLGVYGSPLLCGTFAEFLLLMGCCIVGELHVHCLLLQASILSYTWRHALEAGTFLAVR